MKKILLVADVPGWAWDRNADAIIKYLPEYEVIKQYGTGRLPSNANEFDHIHCMGWLEATSIANIVTAGVCSHNFQIRDQKPELHFNKFMYLTANSKILYHITKQYTDRVVYAPNGVHEDLFTERIKKPEQKFIVGWTGQKTEGGLSIDKGNKIDIKGFNLILKPLQERLKKHSNIEFKILSNNYKRAIPHHDMPDFYTDVDLQICTSFREGTPNPMFEAASCGKPLISTKVGAISELLDESGGGFLINAYNSEADISQTIDAFEEKILYLYDNRELGLEMGIKNREIIEKEWTWKNKVNNFRMLFDKMVLMPKYSN